MGEKKLVGIRTPEGEIKQALLKAFSSGSSTVVLVGEDFDDHALWQLEGDRAALLGTLKKQEWDAIRRVRRGGECKLEVGEKDGFDFAPKSSEGKRFVLRCVDAATVGVLGIFVSDASAIGE